MFTDCIEQQKNKKNKKNKQTQTLIQGQSLSLRPVLEERVKKKKEKARKEKKIQGH